MKIACLCYVAAVSAAGTKRRLSGYVMDDTSIRTAVAAWFSDKTAAEETYGHISTWETGEVTDMRNLFRNKGSFNEDISAWSVYGVTDMYEMFGYASAFDQDLGWCLNDRDLYRYM